MPSTSESESSIKINGWTLTLRVRNLPTGEKLGIVPLDQNKNSKSVAFRLVYPLHDVNDPKLIPKLPSEKVVQADSFRLISAGSVRKTIATVDSQTKSVNISTPGDYELVPAP